MESWIHRAEGMSAKEAAIAHLAQSSSTRHVRDLAVQAMLVREGGIAEVLAARAHWLDYLTVQQRKWQASGSRRPSRARHHDSIAIREKYVRCAS